MLSPYCEMAIADAQDCKKAILKVISPNDVGQTGGHQSGYYLPKKVWHLFSPQSPEKNVNHEHPVKVIWQDGRQTDSIVHWYGTGTRSEYRLTRFGRDFPYLTSDNVGDLLVLIPKSLTEFNAYVLDLDEDIEEIQATLGVEIIKSWVAYEEGKFLEETEDVCLNRKFRELAAVLDKFPPGLVFSEATRDAVIDCVKGFNRLTPDRQLVRFIQEEYSLYKMVERKIYEPEVQRLFKNIDDFLDTAMSILQARRSRAGRSLEIHVEYLLKQANIPHQMRPKVDNTEPDIIIPSKIAYDDPRFPLEKLFIIGVKTTCKDRWRQVIQEAPRIPHKHIITIQKGISTRQLDEILDHDITLVVPEPIHSEYPPNRRTSLISIQTFLESVKAIYP